MRRTFVDSLIVIAENDPDIILLTDDLGYSFLEPFQKKFPEQFINCGIIEQAMTGIAAGLAHRGKKVYVYGTIPFVIMRNYEQLRDDVCYNENKVVFIGISHSGFLGFSHNIEKDEDVSILENLKNLDIYLPINKEQLQDAMFAIYGNNNSAYIRI